MGRARRGACRAASAQPASRSNAVDGALCSLLLAWVRLASAHGGELVHGTALWRHPTPRSVSRVGAHAARAARTTKATSCLVVAPRQGRPRSGAATGGRAAPGARAHGGGGATSAASTAARTPRATRASTGETAARAPRATRSSGGGCRCARVPRAPALLPRRGATPGAAFPTRRRRGLQTRKLLGLRSGQEGGARTCGGLAERSRGLAGTGDVTGRSRPARVRLFPPRSATGRPTLQLLYTFCASRSSAHQRRALGALGRSCDPRYVVSLVIHAGGCSCPLPGMPTPPWLQDGRRLAARRRRGRERKLTRGRRRGTGRRVRRVGRGRHGAVAVPRVTDSVASSPARRQERISV